MDDKNAFLEALKENDDDDLTRSVYADWLEEKGLTEEADRQRAYPAAKKLLQAICEEAGFPYFKMLAAGYAVFSPLWREDYDFALRLNDDLVGGLRSHLPEIVVAWSVVTGQVVPDDWTAGFFDQLPSAWTDYYDEDADDEGCAC